jgi:TusA-related sulfurtransferase
VLDANRADDHFSTNLEICYEVLLYLAGRLAKLNAGQSLDFVSSDATAAEKVPTWVEQREFELVSQHALPDGRLRFVIRKPTP